MNARVGKSSDISHSLDYAQNHEKDGGHPVRKFHRSVSIAGGTGAGLDGDSQRLQDVMLHDHHFIHS